MHAAQLYLDTPGWGTGDNGFVLIHVRPRRMLNGEWWSESMPGHKTCGYWLTASSCVGSAFAMSPSLCQYLYLCPSLYATLSLSLFAVHWKSLRSCMQNISRTFLVNKYMQYIHIIRTYICIYSLLNIFKILYSSQSFYRTVTELSLIGLNSVGV